MNPSNTLATASIGAGIGALLLMFVGYCAGMVPIVGPLVALILLPVEWILAFTGLVTGIVGYRTAGVLGGAGRGSALGGLALSGVFFALQALLMLLACFGVGAVMVLDAL